MMMTFNTSNVTFIEQEHNITIQMQSSIPINVLMYIIIGLFDVILLPTAVVMNVIALVVYGRHVTRKPTVYFLRNLAVSDLLIPLAMFVIVASASDRHGCLGFVFIHFFMYIGGVTVNAVLALVLEQVIRLAFPGRLIFTQLKVAVTLLVMWLFPAIVVYVIPLIHYYAMYVYYEDERLRKFSFCAYMSSQSVMFDRVAVRAWVGYCFICLAAIFAMYIFVYVKVKRMLKSVDGGVASRGVHKEHESAETKARNEMLKLTVLLLVCLVVFWGPLLIAWAIFSTRDAAIFSVNGIDYMLLWQLIVLFTLLNPIADPIIILLKMGDVKKGYHAVCCCCCIRCKNQRGNLDDHSATYTKTVNTHVELHDM